MTRPSASRAGLLAAVLLGLLASLLVGTHAGASTGVPVPVTRTFTKAIEPLAWYDDSGSCDLVDKPGTLKLAALLHATYGQDIPIGLSYNACGGVSEHNEGRALDWMVSAGDPAQKAMATTFLSWLLRTDQFGNRYAMARRLGVMYIIWNRHMWRAYEPSLGWAPYTGSNPHTDHVHISLSWDGASGRTSFWTGTALDEPACAPSVLNAPPPSLPGTPLDFVPVAPTKVLSTHDGIGTVNGPCRLTAGRRVDAIVTGVGAVPATGVPAVVVQISARRPNAPSGITAGRAGAALPPVRRLSADIDENATAVAVLQVGSDGKVSFATSMGATDLVVSVLGYYTPAAASTLGSGGGLVLGSRFHPVAAARLLSGGTRLVPAQGSAAVQVTGRAGVPVGAAAAVVSVTARATPGSGALYAHGDGQPRPSAAALFYPAGRARTTHEVVPLGPNGQLVLEDTGSVAKAVDVDLLGWFGGPSDTTGLGFRPRSPVLLADSATATGLAGALGPGGSAVLDLAGAVPTGTRAVVVQVTVRKPATATRLTFWDPDVARPGTTDLAVPAGQTETTTTVVPVSARGTISVYNAAGAVSLRVDVVGSYL